MKESHSESKSGQSTPETKPTSSKLKVTSSLLFRGGPTELISPVEEGVPKKLVFYMLNENITTVLEMSSTLTISQALMIFLASQVGQPLDQDINHYEVFMAKKNGLPKDEYGSFLPEQQIGKTGTTNFSVVHVAEMSPRKIERKPKRKNTDSPERIPKQASLISSYSNHLNEMDQWRQQKKALSKEIENIPTKVHKKNWILEIFGCGCSKE